MMGVDKKKKTVEGICDKEKGGDWGDNPDPVKSVRGDCHN